MHSTTWRTESGGACVALAVRRSAGVRHVRETIVPLSGTIRACAAQRSSAAEGNQGTTARAHHHSAKTSHSLPTIGSSDLSRKNRSAWATLPDKVRYVAAHPTRRERAAHGDPHF